MGAKPKEVEGNRDLEEAERPGGRDNRLVETGLREDHVVRRRNCVLVFAQSVLRLYDEYDPSSHCTKLRSWSVWEPASVSNTRKTYCRQDHKDIVPAERLDDDGPRVDSERDEDEGEEMEDGQDRDQRCCVALCRPSGVDGCCRCRHVDRRSPADLPVSRPRLGLLELIDRESRPRDPPGEP